jgi:uncharacterized protein
MQATRLDELLSKDARARLLAFRRDLVQALPGSVEDVILFGSRARRDAGEDSDYDVAVVLSGGLADDREIRRRVSDVAWDHQADGYVIQAVALNVDAFQSDIGGRRELALRIDAEGVQVR